jgi:hypothetical protein
MPLELNHISRACLHNNHSSPQHQRYPRDPQHLTPKGVSALPQYYYNFCKFINKACT